MMWLPFLTTIDFLWGLLMRSKTISLFILFTLFLNASCSEFLSGKKKEDDVIEVQGTELDCLESAAETLRKFERQTTPLESLDQALGCFQTSLSYFKSKTKGSVQDPDNYTIENLRTFFGKFLGDQNRVSAKLGNEMMRLKAAVFGGDSESMSKVELQRLIDFFALVRRELVLLKPFWTTIIVTPQNKKITMTEINEAHRAFMNSIQKLVSSTQLSRADYELENFKDLISEIERFTKEDEQKSQVNALNVTQWVPLFESLKNALFGSRIEMNSMSKWREAFRMVGELHRAYLIYYYELQPYSFYSREGMKSVDQLLVLFIKLLDSSWILNSSGISFEVTETLFNSLKKLNMLPAEISGKGLDETYRSIVARVLERESRFPKESVTALEKRHLTFLKVEYEIWKTSLSFVEEFPENFEAKTVDQKLKEFKPKFSHQFAVPNQQTLVEAWEDWKHHLSQDIPLLYVNSGEIVISPYVRDMKRWPWYNLARQNIMRTLSRTLLLGYGVKRTTRLSDTGINEQSLLDWYIDNTLLGVEIKAFDPRAPNSGKRSFFEANHFVYSGNGDEWADRQEVYEFVNIIFSSGLAGLTSIQDQLKKAGCSTTVFDIFGQPWFNEDCFKKTLRSQFHIMFKNLPGFVYYIRSLNDAQWDSFYNDLVSFSRNDPKEAGRIETADLRTLVVILHYIESMYIKIDSDRDDRLSKEELILGSKRFLNFFKKQFNLTATPGGLWDRTYNFLVPQGFACLVLTGEMPTPSSCTKVFLQDAWSDRYSDRQRIIKTLNQLQSTLK
jgi:hypothetical protein